MRKWILFLFLSLTLTARAQTFTNSATLSASIDGTNLVIAYSLANTQGWVTLFQADRPESLLAQTQPLDYAPAPVSGYGEFRVPLDPAAPTKFYRLLLEQWLTRGRALVFIDGPLDFAAMRQTYGDITNGPSSGTPMVFKQPVEVWLDHLGVYDPETGVQIGDNGGVLNGKYGNTELATLNPPLSRVISSQNDFKIDYLGSGVGLREGILWSSEAQFYHDVNYYRSQIFNDSFIEALNLPTEIKNNVLNRQFRPDLDMGQPPVLAKPILRVRELYTSSGIALAPIGNVEDAPLRTRGSGFESLPPLSHIYDSEVTLGDFAGLMAFWVLGSNKGWFVDVCNG